MLRLIHAQTVQGALLVDDIDDGLPNKTAHRLGSVADPNAYARDGYANKPKQSCYIPRVKPTDATIPGYIDLEESTRVLPSGHLRRVTLQLQEHRSSRLPLRLPACIYMGLVLGMSP
jgi:hypothetical protein